MKMLLAGTMLVMMSVAALPEPVQAWTCPYDLVPTDLAAPSQTGNQRRSKAGARRYPMQFTWNDANCG